MMAIGVMLVIAGAAQLNTSLDDLWARHERRLLARGEAPMRNGVWESKARQGGGVLIGFGVVFFILAIIVQVSVPPKMSGVLIDGHELTQSEWDGCHHDMAECVTVYTKANR